MYTQVIEFATPQFDVALRLRDQVLRKPLNMEFYPEDIAKEFDSIHLGCYTDADNLLGVLTLKPVDNKILKMRQVAVSPSSQGKGVGTFLVQAAEILARRNGCSKFELHARDTAVRFYEKMNYTTVGEKFTEVGIPHYKMEKKLS